MKTTLNKIKEHNPGVDSFEKLLKNLGKTEADDEELEILTILNSNGLEDALWCLRAVEGYDKEMRLFAVWCARQVQHLMKDERSIKAIDVAERYANGEATIEELDAASSDAWDAASDDAWVVTITSAFSGGAEPIDASRAALLVMLLVIL